MGQYKESYRNPDTFIRNSRTPDFNQLLKVLKKEKPDRPPLFEFFLNDRLYDTLTRHIDYDAGDPLLKFKKTLDAYRIAGYDYVTLMGSDFGFNKNVRENKSSVSLNSNGIITDEASFRKYQWNDPEAYDYSRLEKLGEYMPDGMKLIVYGNDGVLENVVSIVGYENLCYLMIDEHDLVKEIFDNVGSRLVKYYEICASYDSVGALISNDDWGFFSQTMLSADDLRRYVTPWHKRIVEVIHKAGKPAILHSCGQLSLVMEDIIDDIKFDGKHSYEDKILPVEQAYEKYGERIAVLGGIDVDFICRAKPEEVYHRAKALLRQTSKRGGYALGSGNSIPYYVPDEGYFAMIAAGLFE